MPQDVFVVVVRYGGVVGVFSEQSLAAQYIASINFNSTLGKECYLIEEYTLDELVGEN